MFCKHELIYNRKHMADWIFSITYAVMLGSGVTALIKYVLRDNEIHRVNAVLIDTWEY